MKKAISPDISVLYQPNGRLEFHSSDDFFIFALSGYETEQLIKFLTTEISPPKVEKAAQS